MAQQQNTISNKSTGESLSASEFNELKNQANSNATDIETRVTSLEEVSSLNLDIQYNYDDDTTNPAGSGQFRANNADLTLATELRLSYIVRGSTDIENFLKFKYSEGAVDAKIYFQKNNNANVFAIYTITNLAFDDANNQFTLTVSYDSGNPALNDGNSVAGELIVN